jgi:membrane-bound lytic murein transglycosylase F
VESRWQAEAVSRDGASGLMMLTSNTAGSLGVTDRSDPQQSIFAGARYLVQVRGKIPERIPEPDRSWFTLAAYNMGYGHLEDARVLAQHRGGNPDRWADVAKVLPLLAEERYYSRAKRGYARGWEPVRMVEKVQLFLKLLEWQGEALARPPAGTESD